MRQINLLFLLLFAQCTVISQGLKAQKNTKILTITGKVIDQASGEALPYASVYVEGNTTLGTLTNVDGYFSLLNVPTDSIVLWTRHLGYVPRRIQISALTKTSITIGLDFANELQEVKVSAEKSEMLRSNQEVGMLKISPRDIYKLPTIGERDPFRVFQLMPGVSSSNESSSGLYVRGGTPDQTLVLYDGFTVYHVDHLFGFFSAFNYNALKDIRLYRGGFDAKYGERVSAVAEITGKDGNSNHLNMGIDLGLLSANAYVEAPIGKKLTFLVAGRRSWPSPLYKQLFSHFKGGGENTTSTSGTATVGSTNPSSNTVLGGKVTAASYFYDLNAKLTFRPTTKDIISLSLFNGIDNMDNSTSESSADMGIPDTDFSFKNKNTDKSEWGNLGSSLRWARQWNTNWYSKLILSTSHYHNIRQNAIESSFTTNGATDEFGFSNKETNNITDQSVKIDIEWKATSAHQVEFGGQYIANKVSYKYLIDGEYNVLDRNDTGTTAAIYIQDKWHLGRLEMIPGIRLTYFNATKKNYVEPRFSFNYQVSSKFKIKGATGIYHQFIKQVNREDISQGNRNFWILANNSSLPVTRSFHTILGGSYETPKYLFDVEIYQKNNTGVSEYTLRFVPQIGEDLTLEETFFNGSEQIQGIDVLVQRKVGRLTGWLGYTYSTAVRKIESLSSMPYYSDQDVRHQLKAVALYEWGKWNFSATWLFSTGRPFTSIIGTYDVNLPDGSVKNFINPSEKNSNRFPHYHRLDLSATYHLHKNWQISASIFNAYNRQNSWYKRFQMLPFVIGGVNPLQITDVNFLGLTPSLIVSWKLH
jgi:ferric enterobactin receptor